MSDEEDLAVAFCLLSVSSDADALANVPDRAHLLCVFRFRSDGEAAVDTLYNCTMRRTYEAGQARNQENHSDQSNGYKIWSDLVSMIYKRFAHITNNLHVPERMLSPKYHVSLPPHQLMPHLLSQLAKLWNQYPTLQSPHHAR